MIIYIMIYDIKHSKASDFWILMVAECEAAGLDASAVPDWKVASSSQSNSIAPPPPSPITPGTVRPCLHVASHVTWFCTRHGANTKWCMERCKRLKVQSPAVMIIDGYPSVRSLCFDARNTSSINCRNSLSSRPKNTHRISTLLAPLRNNTIIIKSVSFWIVGFTLNQGRIYGVP